VAATVTLSRRFMAAMMDRDRPNTAAVLTRESLRFVHMYTGRLLATAPVRAAAARSDK
jgi:hypothetical protein